jgi:hypothetical protein
MLKSLDMIQIQSFCTWPSPEPSSGILRSVEILREITQGLLSSSCSRISWPILFNSGRGLASTKPLHKTQIAHETAICRNPHISSYWDFRIIRQLGYKRTFYQNMVSVNNCLHLNFPKSLTCLAVGLLRIGRGFFCLLYCLLLVYEKMLFHEWYPCSPHYRKERLQLILTEQFSHQQLTALYALPRNACCSQAPEHTPRTLKFPSLTKTLLYQ